MAEAKSWKMGVLIIGSAVIGSMGAQFAVRKVVEKIHDQRLMAIVPSHPGMSPQDRLRLARKLESNVGRRLESPTLDQDLARVSHLPIRNDTERHAAAASVAAKGMVALTAPQLDEFFALRIALAEHSPVVCAGLWSGSAPQPEVFFALSRLTEPQLDRWMALSVESTRLALRRDFVVPPADDLALQQVFADTRASLTPEDQQVYDRVISAAEAAVPAEGCKIVVALFRQAQRSDPSLRLRFYRALLRLS